MDYAAQATELPGWSQQLIVCPSLLRIELGLWVAPERQRWSVDFTSFDHRSEQQLSMFVGNERHGLRIAEVRHALMTGLSNEWKNYVALAGPFDE